MNNYEALQQLTLEQTKWFLNLNCNGCDVCCYHYGDNSGKRFVSCKELGQICVEGIGKWLAREQFPEDIAKFQCAINSAAVCDTKNRTPFDLDGNNFLEDFSGEIIVEVESETGDFSFILNAKVKSNALNNSHFDVQLSCESDYVKIDPDDYKDVLIDGFEHLIAITIGILADKCGSKKDALFNARIRSDSADYGYFAAVNARKIGEHTADVLEMLVLNGSEDLPDF